MSKFKVGDRVAVYDGGERFLGVVKDDSELPNRVSVGTKGYLDNSWYHPKQCRRLKKKQKQRLWVNEYPDNGLTVPCSTKEIADVYGPDRTALLECVVVKRHEVKK